MNFITKINLLNNAYFRLFRFNNLGGIFIVATPCWIGTALACNDLHSYCKWMSFFTIGAIIMRPLFCIINDIIDVDIDKLVERTKTRPIASGEISKQNAIIMIFFLLTLSLFLFFSINIVAKIIALFGFLMACVYPLMKRIMRIPQLFLGITSGIGALISFAAITGKIDSNIMAIYFACIMWQTGFDTIYSLNDMIGDKIANVNSAALFLNGNVDKFVYNLYSAFLLVFFLIGIKLKLHYFFYIMLLITAYLMYDHIFCVNSCDRKDFKMSFKLHSVVGIVISFGLFFGKILK